MTFETLKMLVCACVVVLSDVSLSVHYVVRSKCLPDDFADSLSVCISINPEPLLSNFDATLYLGHKENNEIF